MNAARRVALAVAVAGLLAFNLACPGPGPAFDPPETRYCEGAPATAAIDALSASYRFERGGQGAEMILIELGWEGADVPACALAEVRIVDVDGSVIHAQSAALETRGSTGLFFIIDSSLCGATLEVDSYGAQAREPIWRPGCPVDDAGTLLDGGTLDAG